MSPVDTDGGGGSYNVTPGTLQSSAKVLLGMSFRPATVQKKIQDSTVAAPAAGNGINAALGTFQAGWSNVLTEVGVQYSQMSTEVDSAASIYISAEATVSDGFQAFTK
jgi:hypothetical protein